MPSRVLQERAVPATRLVLRFAPSNCRWCRSCELACSLFHEGVCSPSLARLRLWVNTLQLEVEAELCAQCRDAACVEACPVDGAIILDSVTGAILIREGECTACGACAAACPFNAEGNILFYSGTRDAYVKCDSCAGRPKCVEVCPTGALRIEETDGAS
jgi:Fe-S-cluster-containing hydrogenase component 2